MQQILRDIKFRQDNGLFASTNILQNAQGLPAILMHWPVTHSEAGAQR